MSRLFQIAFALLMALSCAYAAAATDIESLVDPTRPLQLDRDTGNAAGLLNSLLGDVSNSYMVSSIIVRNEDRIAVVNGKRVRAGDVVGLARVQRIEPKSVILNQDGEQITLELFSGSIKTLVKQDGQ